MDSMLCGQLETDAVAFSALVSACGQGSAWARALYIFATAALGTIACNSAISGCERAGRWQPALQTLQSGFHRRLPPTIIGFNAAISASEEDRQWQRSCSLFTSLLEVPLVPSIVSFGAAASSLAAARRWRRSLHVVDQLKHWEVPANAVVFNAVLSALTAARRPELARSLLGVMHERSIAPTVISYNSAIAACESVGAWEEAWHLLMEMKNRRLLPDLISFNSAISCCQLSGSWQMASHFLLSLRKAELAPDLVSFGALIGACAGVGQWQQALAFVSSMNVYHLVPNLLTVNSVASAFEKGCQWQRVLRLLMYDPDLITYNCALLACQRAGQWRAAAQLLATMEEARVQADLVSFNTAGVLCERHGCWEWLEVCLGRLADMLQQELVKETVGPPHRAARRRRKQERLDSLALAPQFSFFGMMAKQVALEHPSFGVFLADTDAEVSEISFGGSSEDKVASPMTWAPVALPDLGYWQVEIKAIRIGDRTLDYCADGQCRAVVDTGTSLLAVPEDFADGLQEALEQRLEDPDQGPDGGGFVKDAFPELFVEGQVVSAEQSFHRRLAEYEMNIEQQKLFREDLRDLVELTVGRMDVYHLVGALLLELQPEQFCIHFYCENRMIEEAGESQSKAFLVVFFLLSNLRQALGEFRSDDPFGAFAPTEPPSSAEVAFHARFCGISLDRPREAVTRVRVRLLTSFARLSIPTRKELEEVAKVPLVPMPGPCVLQVSASRSQRRGASAVLRILRAATRCNALRPDGKLRVVLAGPGWSGSASLGSDWEWRRHALAKRCLAQFLLLKGRAGEGSAGDGDGSETREAYNITLGSSVALSMRSGQGREGATQREGKTKFVLGSSRAAARLCETLDVCLRSGEEEVWTDGRTFAGELRRQQWRLFGRSDLAIQEGAKALSDREFHFRRFLKEQRRWLFYDAYARICMALGMNQLLCALSYYILGAIAEEAEKVTGRVQSWGGVIMVSASWFDVLALLVCMSFPPMYMGVLIHFVDPASVSPLKHNLR
ncbi:unnamed protein product, partial [Symbiodinium microadriaticum]